MAGEEHKALARRFFAEVFNEQDWAVAAEIVAPDFVAHHPQFPQGITGIDGLKGVVAMFRGGFPDLQYTLEDFVAEGDRVAVRWRATGTHNGPLMGVPATGRQVITTGIDIFRISERKLAESWINSDILGLLQQLGAVSSPG